jgi:hypothetical protein
MRRVTVVAVLAAALCVPATAAADDSSVYGAYVSRDADFTKLGKQVRRGLRTWRQSDFNRAKPALKALAATAKTCDELSSAIDAEQSSSDHGTRAKAAALASINYLGRSTITAAQGVRAGTHGHTARANRLLGKATRQLKTSGAKEKVARREFKAAGVEIKPAP